jgi:hypothetical protein
MGKMAFAGASPLICGSSHALFTIPSFHGFFCLGPRPMILMACSVVLRKFQNYHYLVTCYDIILKRSIVNITLKNHFVDAV